MGYIFIAKDVCTYICVHIHIIYIYVCVYRYMHIHIHIFTCLFTPRFPHLKMRAYHFFPQIHHTDGTDSARTKRARAIRALQKEPQSPVNVGVATLIVRIHEYKKII